METTEKKEMTFEEEKQECLKELYGWDYAKRTKTAPISKNTRAALYFKGMVQDVVSTLYSLRELFYGEVGDKESDEYYEATRKLDEIADRYIIESISERMGELDFKEI